MENPERLYDLDEWKNLVISDSWVRFVNLVIEHEEYLNKQALIGLDNKREAEALEYRIRARECRKILDIVERKINDLRKG